MHGISWRHGRDKVVGGSTFWGLPLCMGIGAWAFQVRSFSENIKLVLAFHFDIQQIMKTYIELKDLEVYRLSRNLSTLAWEVYSKLDYQQKKIIGDQFIRSVDSVGANIAEGYARYHYLDKARFYHFSRASLSEALEHWAELMFERSIIQQATFEQLKNVHQKLEVKLNNFITATYKNANNSKKRK